MSGLRAASSDARLSWLTWLVMVLGVGINLALTGFTAQPNRLAVMLFCIVFFSILAARLILAMRGRRRGRLALGALLFGVVMWAAESALLQTAQSRGHGEHLASGEFAFLGTYLVFVVFLLLDAEHRPARAAATWLETAVICGGSASLAGMLLLTPLAAGKPDAVPLLVAILYPVADVMLILVVIAQVGLRMRASTRRSWQLCLGFLILAIADVSFVGNVMDGSAGSSVLNIVLWGAGFAHVVTAVCRRTPQEAIAPTGDLPVSILVGATVVAAGVLVVRPDGNLGVCLVVSALATLLAGGARMIIALRDARGAAEAIALAQTDDLTKLPNRRAVRLRMDADIEAGRPLALMTMDLNGFKDINDSLGHTVGDVILQMCARRMRAALPHNVLVARLGSDEFAFVLPETDPIRLMELANVALAAVREPAIAHGIELVVDASVGIAVPTAGEDSSELLRRADVAMYQARTSGVHVTIYEPARDEFSRDRLRMVEELRHAISDGQLVLWYQPQIDAATQSICGMEALVRWQHPRQGLIPPAAFLPVARHAGLMPALCEAVIRRAAADMRIWHTAALGVPVALNCPPPELLSGVFMRQLLGAIAETGLAPADFLIEVTEDSFLSDPERARDILCDVRDEGFTISIDDYGVGFSSLAYLRDLPIDELKMDRSFIATMTADRRSRMIVESTIAMAHALELRVVAEGVEDAPTSAMLVAMGVDVLQGYHLSRPMPPDHVIGWVRQWRASLAGISG